jgi:quercetin dioxygenase-like cupin family protein
MPSVQAFAKPDWRLMPLEGFRGVEVQVLWSEEYLLLARLRFAEHATINPHAGPNDAYVSCLSGSGFTSVGDEAEPEPFEEGQRVFWPKGVVHGLWTEDSTMTTLMCELPAASPPG